MTTTAATSHHIQAPPITHAISGSLASTLSMLLFYPLERVRIEMQAQASTIQRDEHTTSHLAMEMEDEGGIDENKKCPSSLSSSSLPSSFSLPSVSSPSPSPSPSSSDNSNSTCSSFELIPQKDSPNSIKKDHQPLTPSSLQATQLMPTSQAIPKQLKLQSEVPPEEITSLHSKSKRSQPQPQRNILKSSKLIQTMYTLHIQRKLYRGSTPVALTLALSNFVFFYTLQYLKKISDQQSASFLTSTIAGVINVLLTNPFWVANLRIVKNDIDGNCDEGGNNGSCNKNMGLFQTLLQIIQEEGIGQLWNGTGASLLLVTNPAIQYYTYERIKMDLIRNRKSMIVGGQQSIKSGLRPMEAFVLGAFSKGLATVITYPLQLAQVLLRLQKSHKESLSITERSTNKAGKDCDQSQQPSQCRRQYNGLLDCIMDLYKRGGVRALFAGMDAKLLQTVLTAALTFLTYEELLQVVARSYWAITIRARPLLGPMVGIGSS